MLGLKQLLFILLFIFNHSIFCLQVDIDPIQSIANGRRIDSVQILMRGLLQQGDHDNLLKILQFSIYDFEPLYLEKVCPHLDSRNIQTILENYHLKPAEEKLLLSPACLAAGRVLSNLDRHFALLLPANPLVHDSLDFKTVKSTLFHDLLLRAIDERAPLNSIKVLKYLEEKYFNDEVMKNHSWRLITEESFCAQDEEMKQHLLHLCATGILPLTPASPKEVYAESLQRTLTLVSIKKYLQKCPCSRTESLFEAVSGRLLGKLNDFQLPQDPISQQIVGAMLKLLTGHRISLDDYSNASLDAHIPQQPDWIVENLDLFTGSALQFTQFAQQNAIIFRKQDQNLLKRLRYYLNFRFGWQNMPVKQVSDSRSLQSRLRKTRAQFLPISIHQQRLNLPVGENAYDRLADAWQTFKRIDFYRKNSFQFFYFGFRHADGFKIVYDRRHVFRMVLMDFFRVPELYFKLETGNIVPSPLCSTSLLSSLAVLMHQNALLREDSVFVLDWDYFKAALDGDIHELAKIYFEIFSAFNPTFCKFNFLGETDLEDANFFKQLLTIKSWPESANNDPLYLDHIESTFVDSAFSFAATLHDVFPEKDYTIQEIYAILFLNNKRIT